MPKAVIFDVDGTLVDSVDRHAQAWQEAFREFGYEFDFADIRGQIGKGGDQLMPVFLPPDAVVRIGQSLQKRRSEIFKQNHLRYVTGFPAVRALFERLRQDRLKIVLASSAKQDELESYKRIAQIEDLVRVETSSDDAERSKPHPDIFVAALRQLPGIEPDEVIAVGDTPYDAAAAGKAGVRTIGVLSGGFPEVDLRGAGCIAIYRDPADLLEKYDASPLSPRREQG
jgi:HAD superfamily hydrolase (TIGR01549 family)